MLHGFRFRRRCFRRLFQASENGLSHAAPDYNSPNGTVSLLRSTRAVPQVPDVSPGPDLWQPVFLKLQPQAEARATGQAVCQTPGSYRNSIRVTSPVAATYSTFTRICWAPQEN